VIARVLASVLLLSLTACTTAASEPVPPSNDADIGCTFTHKVRTVDSLKKLPGPIRKFLASTAEQMADRGEFFNAGDVVTKPAPFNRFIRGGEIGEKWFVWYEHGGFAYWKQIVIIGSDPSGKPHAIAEAHGGQNLCADTDALLDKTLKLSP